MNVGLLSVLLGSLLLAKYVNGFSPSRLSTCFSKRISPSSLASDMDDEIPEDAVPLDSPEVKYVLDELMKTLEKSAGITSASDVAGTDDMIQDVNAGFAKLLSEIKGSSKLTETQKRLLTAETALTMNDANEGDDNAVASASASTSAERLGENPPVKTLVYSQQHSPYLVVHGPGPVGSALVAFMKALGSSVSVKYLDATTLATAQDSEIAYAVRDCRSVLIAADEEESTSSSGSGGRGFFGALGGDKGTGSIPSFCVNEKGLRRLLNACTKTKQQGQQPLKVVALGAAAKEPRGLASLLGGDTFSLDSEVVLQCRQRQLAYTVVKTGRSVDRDRGDSFEPNERLRPPRLDRNNVPFVFTRSRVQPAEVTEVGVAVEALLRAASHPHTNSSVSVVSIDPKVAESRAISDAEWDDEFLRLEGPELARIPLRHASALQMSIKVGRVARELQQPGRGLVTPIEVMRYSNGVKILFRPADSSYLSSREEKEQEQQEQQEQQQQQQATKAGTRDTRLGSYVPPEEAMIDPTEGSAVSKGQRRPAGAKAEEEEKDRRSKSRRRQKPEGGLEVIVDSEPYKRVRIRRCNMGPDPVVKEESEAIILKALRQGIKNLEAFYEKMVSEGIDEV